MSSNAGSPDSGQSSNFYAGCGKILGIVLIVVFVIGCFMDSAILSYITIGFFIVLTIVKLLPDSWFYPSPPADDASTTKPPITHIASNFNSIEESYFDTVKEYGEKLYLFLLKLRSDPRLKEQLEKYSLNRDSQNINYPGCIDNLMMTDLLKIYHQLGYRFGEDAKESFALVYLFARISGVTSVTYQTLPDFYNRFVHTIAKYMPTTERQSLGDINMNTFFALGALIQDVDSGMGYQYYLLLYRYASLIIKADGTVTAEESEFLKNVFSLRKDEKDKSVPKPSTDRTDDIDESESKPSTDAPSDSGMNRLHQLVGLDSVKKEVATLVNFIEIRKMRVAKGMKAPDLSYHCVFTGNPGTGKTTVARILASVYKEIGLLSSGHLVETDRSGLVGEYVGHTAIKTNKIVDSALDGVLFIDEAYSLMGGGLDYGKEAISTLLKRMEDDRDRLIVILAGYTDEMKMFIDSNPGLQSRFSRYIEFEDYSEDELIQIFLNNLERYDYSITNEAIEKLRLLISKAIINKDRNFGNARWIRNIFEKTLENQANRLATEGNISKEALITIIEDDIL